MIFKSSITDQMYHQYKVKKFNKLKFKKKENVLFIFSKNLFFILHFDNHKN